MTFELNANTKMALRAVVVALICIWVTNTLSLERSYWVFLTGFLLITQSFGDGIYRSLMRFILTIIGCLLGWVIYLPFAHSTTALTIICFTTMFLMLYWMTTSLIARTITTGILVVISFGMMNGGWTFAMLMARIQDTFIGAAIAIFVNGLILPEFSKSSVKKTFDNLRTQLSNLHQKLMTSKTREKLVEIQHALQDLEKEHLILSQSYQLARYELLFRKKRQQEYKTMLMQTDIVFFYFNALLAIKFAELSDQSSIKKELAKSGETYYKTRLDNELERMAVI